MPAKRRPYTEPQAISSFLPRFMRSLKPRSGVSLDALRAAWPGAVGEAALPGTRLLSYESGVLTVVVSSAALRHHLATFRNEEILMKLGRSVPKARLSAIRYKIGS